MSSIRGGGNVVTNQQVAHQTAFQMHRRQHETTQQNLRWSYPNRHLLLQLVQDIASKPVEDIQHLAEVVEEARRSAAPAAALAAEIGSLSRFGWLLNYLPEDKNQGFNFVAMLATVLSLIVTILVGIDQHRSQPAPTISPEQVEEIVKRLVDHEETEHHKQAPQSEPPCQGEQTTDPQQGASPLNDWGHEAMPGMAAGQNGP